MKNAEQACGLRSYQWIGIAALGMFVVFVLPGIWADFLRNVFFGPVGVTVLAVCCLAVFVQFGKRGLLYENGIRIRWYGIPCGTIPREEIRQLGILTGLRLGKYILPELMITRNQTPKFCPGYERALIYRIRYPLRVRTIPFSRLDMEKIESCCGTVDYVWPHPEKRLLHINLRKLSHCVLILAIGIVLLVNLGMLTMRIRLTVWDKFPFYGMSAEEILQMEHFDLGYYETTLQYGGRDYESIPDGEYPYPLTGEHLSEYVIVEIVNQEGNGDYALLRHKDDTGLQYLLSVPERGPEYFEMIEIKRPLACVLMMRD